ncbi:MAG: response regulator [Roseiflexus sp.]|jgi:signal transduction histidine kinase/ActR/RegA family two-component response regulator|nr:response regulator [Roseiflexus sp.]
MGHSPAHDQPDSADLLFEVIDHIPVGILVVSLPDFRILAINARACARLGIRISATVTGRLCRDVIPRFSEDRLDNLWLSMAGLQHDDSVPATQLGRAMSRRWQAYTVRDQHGQAVRLLLVWLEAGETPEHQFASSAQHITQALISTLDRDQLLDLILEHLYSIVSYDSAAIILRDDDGYYIAASRGLPDCNTPTYRRLPENDVSLNRIETASEPVIVRLSHEDAVEARCPLSNAPREWLSVPLRAQGDVVGILTLSSRLPNRYTRADAARAQAFATYAALAVRNAELYRRAREQSARLALVNKIARTITATHDLRAIFDHLIDHLHGVVPLDRAELALFDRTAQHLRLIACYPSSDNTKTPRVHYHDQDTIFLRRLIEQRQPMLLPLDDTGNSPLIQCLVAAGIQSCLVVPIVDSENLSGMLLLASQQPNAFPAIEIRTFADLAQHLAVAIQNAQLHQAREQAIANLRIAQQRLIQSERLTAVGELVAGVAHELNNPLTAVLGFAGILQEVAPAEYQHDLTMIVESATRARRIVQNLLTFARQRETHLEEVDLNLAVQQVLSLLAYQMRTHNISIEERLQPQLPVTIADSTAIKQVILNLLNNAQQALATWSGQRTIVVTTRLELHENRQWLVLEIADTGPGIAPEHLPRIFEPFFTTKPVGEGTGLGLSICYGIVSQYHGNIRVQSAPGKGACFTVELPVQSFVSVPSTRETTVTVQLSSRYRILVVDDEAAVTELIARLLREQQCIVDMCHDGAQALDLLSRVAYDLIICDVRMPGMSGNELFIELKQRAPHLARRVLFISGDTASHSTRDFFERSGVGYIEKPFTAAELINAVKRSLASTS